MRTRHTRPAARALAALCLGLLLGQVAQPARADVVLNIQSATAAPGSTGNSLDITLQNTGPSSIDVGAFSFEISTPSSTINLTSATTSTVLATYIFSIGGNHSFFGPTISTLTGQTLDASDAYNPFGTGQVVASGATVGLGHITFDVGSSTTPGNYLVSFTAAPSTSLSDPAGNPITITTLNTGTINVTSAVPEPSPPVLACVAAAAAFGYRWVRGRKRKPHPTQQ